MMAVATEQPFRRLPNRRRVNATGPIAWLDEPVALCDRGHGPRLLGVSKDAALGKWKLQELEARGRGKA